MAQYINKAALVAEIEGKRDMLTHLKYIASNYNDEKTLFAVEKQIEQYESLISFIDTIEVKEIKEPTASDRGMAEEIIINLKRVEQDYHIDLTREMEWLRSKAQKGE